MCRAEPDTKGEDKVDEVFHLLDELKKYYRDPPPVHLPSKIDVKGVENLFSAPLPPAFITFWERIEWAPLSLEGICFPSPLLYYRETPASLAWANLTLWLNEDWIDSDGMKPPDFLLIFDIAALTDDDYSCFDLRNPNQDGEYPIVYWCPQEPDYYVDQNNPDCIIDDLRTVAPDFATFLKRRLRHELSWRSK